MRGLERELHPSLTHPTSKPLLRALNGEAGSGVPFWFMRQAGRYLPEYRALRARAPNFLAFCFDPALAAEATLQPIRRFGMDGAIVFSDILVVPHALGQPVAFREGEGPVLDALRDGSAIDRLAAGRENAAARLAPVGETLRRVARELPAMTALIGFCGAPWTVASYMIEGGSSRDHARVRLFAYRESAAFQRLIDLLVATSIDYLSMQIEAGAEAVQIFDSWAGVLPEEEFERWCLAPIRAIVAGVRARHETVPVIVFPRGAGVHVRDFAARAHAQAVGLDTSVTLDLARAAQRHGAVQGLLDPLLVVAGGEMMDRAARRILEALGHGPLVFNLGHGIVPETPPEHVARLGALIRSWP
jgi:uroporphyrinogen decarboxylase